ncbi:hypothetical protein [Amycolatopsis rubida]|uniref:Uncharacterized protein n=1 Tax=Amycolatopsis rubida TaxID=112413 RepID=A0A1I5L5T8_9PSEU|nr:hypothetical protein [Amycolatopsis rubida]SFO92568.1 hypothetical protein SAMN05421854_103455 [Amycolatopsis rubida]
MTPRSEFRPRDRSEDDDEETPFPARRKKPELPEPDELPGEVATAPGPDLSPSRTDEVPRVPGTDETPS